MTTSLTIHETAAVARHLSPRRRQPQGRASNVLQSGSTLVLLKDPTSSRTEQPSTTTTAPPRRQAKRQRIQPGERFGDLVAVEPVTKTGRTKWLTTCACGGVAVVTGTNLRSGNTKTCGDRKAHPPTKRDTSALEPGQRFGLLTIVKRVQGSPSGGRSYLCRCDCGETTVALASNLKGGRTRSCGSGAHKRKAEISYSGAHGRLRADLGPANLHPCIACGVPAHDWAYLHSDPDVGADTEGKEAGRSFSGSPEHYAALCRSHHSSFDRAHDRLPLAGNLSLVHVVLQAVLANAEEVV